MLLSISFALSEYFFPTLAISVYLIQLVLDGDTHGAGGTCDHAHGSLEGTGVQVGHLGFCDLLHLLLGDLSHLVLVRLSGSGVDTGSLLDQDGSGGSLGDEGT